MVKRIIERHFRQCLLDFPVVTVTGPRQSGKTTLCKLLCKNKEYVNFENIENRDFANNDPVGFLNRYKDGAIFDEIQRVAQLTSFLQEIVDRNNKSGQFVLTGSQQFKVIEAVTQSLAGRTALLKLLPFSISESKKLKPKSSINEYLYNGFYPRIYDKKLNATQTLGNYFETYVERDLRQIANIKNLSAFTKFVKLCAGRIGQLLNLSNISNDLGISHTTLKEWLTILEASYIIYLLPPYYDNIKKRLVKSPKIYFYDVGLATYLLDIESEKYLKSHPLRGNLFENMIIIEILKHRYNLGLNSNLYFYRDNSGIEVDLIYKKGNTISLFEIKSAETISSEFSKNFEKVKNDLKEKVNQSFIVYGGQKEQIRSNFTVTNISRLQQHLGKLEE